MPVLPITLGGVRPDWQMGAWCPDCGSFVQPAIVPILDKFGEHIRLVDLRRHFKCGLCKKRGHAHMVLSPTYAHAPTSEQFRQPGWELEPGAAEWGIWDWSARERERKQRNV